MTNPYTLGATGIISQDAFNQYASTWGQVVTNTAELPLCFGGIPPSPGVNFALDQIQQLVSVPGARYIMAKFLVTSSNQFNIALFAADANRNRLSSYYMGTSGVVSVDPTNEEVPDALAECWKESWEKTTSITPALFLSYYWLDGQIISAPLQGYTFDLNDFLRLFRAVDKIDGESMNIYFGLHSYSLAIQGNDKATQTFGLILRMGNTAPYYDMSAPCPPLC